MSRVTEHDLTPLQQKRMVIERVCGKTRFHRNVLKRDTDLIDVSAIGKSKTRFSCGEAAEQADKSGGEKRNADGNAHFERPSCNQIAPQKWKHKKVGPDHEL